MKKTAITQLIETRKKYIQDLEIIPEWDRRTKQVIQWHKDELAELEKMLQPEREHLKDAFESGCEHGENYHETDFDVYFKTTYGNGE